MKPEALLSIIAHKLDEHSLPRAQIVGINGVDTAGKTRFAQDFVVFLRAQGRDVVLIHGDDFHNPRAIRRQGTDPVRGYIDHAFNLPLLERELLAPARRGEVMDKTLALIDLDTDTPTAFRRYTIRHDTIVLVEGVLLFRPPIDAYFDLRIFLHILFDEVLRRAAARDVPNYGDDYLERYEFRYIPAQKWYLETYRPQQRSDFVIDNTDYANPHIIRQTSEGCAIIKSADVARRLAGRFVADKISYLLRAGEPTLDCPYWRVPICFALPTTGLLGIVGTVNVDVETGTIVITPEQIMTIKQSAESLAKE
jgi:uridine kinase